MGLLTQYLEARAVKWESVTPGTPAEYFVNWLMGGPSLTGEIVNAKTAMGISTAYACIRLITEMMCFFDMLPYKKVPGGQELDEGHQLYPLMTGMANSWQTFAEWKAQQQLICELRGNAYSELLFDGRTRRIVRQVIPMDPDRMEVRREGEELVYYYTKKEGGPPARLTQDRVFHLRGPSEDSIYGISPIRQAMNTFGLAMATERHGARLFGKAARPDGALVHPGKLTTEAKENLKKSMKEDYAGPNNSHGVMVLQEGMEWKPMGLKNNEAQFLETRGMQREEICAIFGVDKELIYPSGGKGVDFDSLLRKFMILCMAPRMKRWRTAWMAQVFTPEDRKTHKAMFDLEDILDGDPLKKAQFIAMMRQWGIYSMNDGRKQIGKNKLDFEEADDYLVPVNMVPSDKIDDMVNGNMTTDKGTDTPPNPDNGVGKRFKTVGKRQENEALKAAFSVIFEEDLRRIQRKEALNVEKNAKRTAQSGTLADFSAWKQQFFADQRSYMAETLKPSVQGLLIALGSTAEAQEIANELAEEHAKRSVECLKDFDLRDLATMADTVLENLLNEAEAMKKGTRTASEAAEFVDYVIERAK